jgi:hypothetical protein
MEEFQWIQFAFPQEPDWGTVRTETLLRLVENFEFEQSCAASALTELSSRNHPAVDHQCRLILTGSKADVWLRATAFSLLFDRDLLWCLDYIRREASACEPALFSEMVSGLWSSLRDEDVPKASVAVTTIRARFASAALSAKDFSTDLAWREYCSNVDEFCSRFGT